MNLAVQPPTKSRVKAEPQPDPETFKKVVETTRTSFEAGYRDDMLKTGMSDEDIADNLKRSKLTDNDYHDLYVNIEWTGWCRGIERGYEIWGKKL